MGPLDETVSQHWEFSIAMNDSADKKLFWGCFIALVTTAFGFIVRSFLLDQWAAEFGLDPAQKGRLMGIGVWPFAVSIIGFSLVIDKIGYKISMIISFAGYMAWAATSTAAYFISNGGQGNTDLAFQLIYWGSLVLALSNGTVEAYINPVVATMFKEEKTKWLNILHAGWPGGLVAAGIVTIMLGDVPWWIKTSMLAAPAVVFFVMLIGAKFPVQERVSSGVSYREMLSEFGVLGALIVSVLIVLQLMDFFSVGGSIELSVTQKLAFVAIGVVIVAAFGWYTRALGRWLMFCLILIMMPLATTEIGTDGLITSIMQGVLPEGINAGWILVYTSAIMMVLRFFAGPIVHKLSPLGLLATCSILAILGLLSLSSAAGAAIFVAATLYGIGKTFFWPTMLGVVSEQMPKGGALTLNAISGIGMLAVGTLGFPFIGSIQAERQIESLTASEVAGKIPGLLEDGKLTVIKEKKIYEIIRYETIELDALKALVKQAAADPKTQEKLQKEVDHAIKQGDQRTLARVAVFPGIMLAAYIVLILYFKSQGGYQAEVLVGHSAEDESFTGGVPGAVE